jgi:hypothetical protein
MPILLTASTAAKKELLGNTVFVSNSSSDPVGQLDVIALSQAHAASAPFNPAAAWSSMGQ